jgi:hypothetical protein
MPATVYVMLLALSISGAPAAKHWHDNDDRETQWQHRDDDDDRDEDARAGGCLFEPNDLRVLADYYPLQRGSLPPGPRKKLYRTGHLTPGSQRSIAPLPLLVEVRMAPLPHHYRRGVIDGYAVIYDPATWMIMDVAVVFGSH